MVTEFIDNKVKNPFITAKKESKEIRVKFNFPLMNPEYDFSQAMKKAKEEKSYIAFEMQSTIDFNLTSSVYCAGKVYNVPLDFYEKFSCRTVQTTNPLFGSFQGKATHLIKRPNIPYMIKVDDSDNYINSLDEKLDLYPALSN